MKPIYKRIMLKLSGEGLMGDKEFGMSPEVIDALARQIKMVYDAGVEICVVVGGGNIFRGAKEASKGMNRTVADHVGMLATVMNALYIQNALEKIDVPARVLSGLNIPEVCEHYIYRRALRHLAKKRVVIFAAGTGNPYFTTDTGAALRASEMQCDVIFKSTQVDGVYDSDLRRDGHREGRNRPDPGSLCQQFRRLWRYFRGGLPAFLRLLHDPGLAFLRRDQCAVSLWKEGLQGLFRDCGRLHHCGFHAEGGSGLGAG